ncbi:MULTISPECIES: AraC family transcriptional regulator [Paenibacillus]|uniref:AraC family transcriptional regulator n=1 Tax=Paenibacillus xylanilyticus TaxID=248903 RepID=A0A7Y6BZC9_9BACL|nr:AraC family transcriptional regulator [Paenibacillus xylanilyticus]NUU77601.1 AraC family transcriptional regulator [Paenibacillus xylanilyticus]
MELFNYKKSSDILALSASFTDFTYKKHCHEEYAVGVTLRGIQQYHLDGHYQASHQNGVMLFNREQSHDGSSYDKAGIDYVMLYLKPDVVEEILGRKELRFSTPIVYDPGLARSILMLNNAVQNGQDEAKCSELLFGLVHLLSRSEIDTNTSGPRDGLVRKAKEMMFCRFDDVLKLDDLCSEFNMSKFQFIREFKSQAGISPYQFFLNCKVERARQAIEKHKDVYSAVADCGFVDLTHLNRHFKRVFGVTAYEYMLQLN